ncbi:hypothetical protein BC835DRAFT_1310673 [Cytidiella melzeri]|nr:hypothetical protein BC835DRAFT_1310673 [Cytidiella melzeri]
MLSHRNDHAWELLSRHARIPSGQDVQTRRKVIARNGNLGNLVPRNGPLSYTQARAAAVSRRWSRMYGGRIGAVMQSDLLKLGNAREKAFQIQGLGHRQAYPFSRYSAEAAITPYTGIAAGCGMSTGNTLRATLIPHTRPDQGALRWLFTRTDVNESFSIGEIHPSWQIVQRQTRIVSLDTRHKTSRTPELAVYRERRDVASGHPTITTWVESRASSATVKLRSQCRAGDAAQLCQTYANTTAAPVATLLVKPIATQTCTR